MRKKLLIVNLILIGVVALYCFLLTVTGITCPFKAIFNIPCPTCGVTRAFKSLFVGDIKGYFDYNAFALPLALAVVSEVNRFAFKKPIVVDIFAITVAVTNFIYYVVVNFIVK